MLVKLPAVLLVDDGTGKPETINLVIGRRPYAAFGNSDGDRQMLEWTQAGDGARLMMLVHHDDPEREYAYGPKSHVGTVLRCPHGRGKAARLDRDQHEKRLEPRVPVREAVESGCFTHWFAYSRPPRRKNPPWPP